MAQEELEESIKWYEKSLVGLGERFAEVIFDSTEAISRNPEAYPVIKAHRRHFVVDKFPFVIVYEILKEENMINVLHIFHTSRNPKFKFRKK